MRNVRNVLCFVAVFFCLMPLGIGQTWTVSPEPSMALPAGYSPQWLVGSNLLLAKSGNWYSLWQKVAGSMKLAIAEGDERLNGTRLPVFENGMVPSGFTAFAASGKGYFTTADRQRVVMQLWEVLNGFPRKIFQTGDQIATAINGQTTTGQVKSIVAGPFATGSRMFVTVTTDKFSAVIELGTNGVMNIFPSLIGPTDLIAKAVPNGLGGVVFKKLVNGKVQLLLAPLDQLDKTATLLGAQLNGEQVQQFGDFGIFAGVKTWSCYFVAGFPPGRVAIFNGSKPDKIFKPQDFGSTATGLQVVDSDGSRLLMAVLFGPTTTKLVVWDDTSQSITEVPADGNPMYYLARFGDNPSEIYFAVGSSGLDGFREWKKATAFVSPPPPPPPPTVTIYDRGIVSNASYAVGASPGAIVSIFGDNFVVGNESAQASTLPLPTSLLGTQVTFDGQPVPLYYVGKTQINAQVPMGLVPGTTARVKVVRKDGSANALEYWLEIWGTSPGVYQHPEFGFGPVSGAIAFHGNGLRVDLNNPAVPGEEIDMYVTGLGYAPGLPTGSSGPATRVVNEVKVTVGGKDALVTWAGYVEGLVGLCQVNFVVPPDAAVDGVISFSSLRAGNKETPFVVVTKGSQGN